MPKRNDLEQRALQIIREEGYKLRTGTWIEVRDLDPAKGTRGVRRRHFDITAWKVQDSPLGPINGGDSLATGRTETIALLNLRANLRRPGRDPAEWPRRTLAYGHLWREGVTK